MELINIYESDAPARLVLKYQPIKLRENSKCRGYLHICVNFLFGELQVDVGINLWNNGVVGINCDDKGRYNYIMSINGSNDPKLIKKWWSNGKFRWFINGILKDHTDMILNTRPTPKNTNAPAPAVLPQGQTNAMSDQETLALEFSNTPEK